MRWHSSGASGTGCSRDESQRDRSGQGHRMVTASCRMGDVLDGSASLAVDRRFSIGIIGRLDNNHADPDLISAV